MKNKTKLLIVIIVIAVYLVVTTIVVGTLFGNCGVATKKDYDMSRVVFEDLTVEYDGQPHSVLATNLPEGVSASYENNNQTEIGTYTVTAHFYGDQEHYNPIPDKTAILKVTKPAKNRILSATGFEIDETSEPPRIYCDVPNTTEHIDLSDKITVMPNRTWKLYKDFDGEEEITSKTMSLETGHNIAYIIITDLINNTSTYEADVYRLDMKSYIFKNEGLVHASGLIEEKSQLASPEIPEKPYYTFTGWAVEGRGDIVKFPYTVTEDITFVAQYKPTEYKITYHLDGGINNEGNPEYYNIESPDIELLPASREGYSFDGWYEDRDYDTQITVIEHGSRGSKELYAKWAYGSGGLIYEQVGNEYKVAGYKGNDSEIVVPDSWKGLPVTEIGKGVFENCTRLEKLTLPFVGANKDGTSYGHIGYIFGAGQRTESADFVPSSLKTVIITGGTYIANYAFYECAGIARIELPADLTSIGADAFYGCTGLENITLPDGVTSIGSSAFWKCTNLKSIIIPASLNSVYSRAFYDCTSLTAVYITDIASWCLIDFNDSEANPLYYARNLYLNNRLLTALEIPASVTQIGSYAFYNCVNLKSVKFGGNGGLTRIGAYAFKGCKSLTSINIPVGVTSIGGQAFYDCWGLESITLPDGITSIGGSAFSNTAYSGDKNNWIDKVLYINNYLIKAQTNISGSYTVISGTKLIAESAFYYCDSLEGIIIPSGISAVPSYMLYGCASLTRVQFPAGLTSIGEGAFGFCKSLESITIPAGVTAIENNTFKGCENLKSVSFGDNSQLTYIGKYAFGYCTVLENIDIPEGVTTIRNQAFQRCEGLNYIYIPSSVTEIGIMAFEHCTNLERVTFGENSKLTDLFGGVFINCTSLKSIEIPSSVTTIRSSVFAMCEKLERVTFGQDSRLTTLSGSVFRDCISLESIEIPASVTQIRHNVFSGCENLKSVIFKNTHGWTAGDTAISSEDLEDPATAAEYLKGTYSDYDWRRAESE